MTRFQLLRRRFSAHAKIPISKRVVLSGSGTCEKFTRTEFDSTLNALAAGADIPGRAADPPQSEWVRAGADGKLVYKTTARGDRIMDFSRAGYQGGGVAIPEVPVVRTVQPSSGDDDTGTIQRAIDEVSAMEVKDGFRGAVLLAPGVFTCPRTINLLTSGVVLRGSGSGAVNETKSTIKMSGAPHPAIAIRSPRRGTSREAGAETAAAGELSRAETKVADAYIPAGANTLSVVDPTGFAAGDTIEIRRPVTAEWIRFMQMDDLVRDGRPQTWMRAGSSTTAERVIAAISDKRITLEVPLADSYDAKYLNPPGTAVVKVNRAVRLAQVGVEHLQIESPPQEISHSQPHFTAIRLNGEDCWLRDVVCEETMNSIGINGRRITLQQVAVNRKARHQGSSKPAEFAPNASQLLLDRCSGSGDNVWYAATGGGQAGPIVMLHCTFNGNGRIESHQRWSTGMLYDNCRVANGGIDFRNRGEMGSGHGWTMSWGVAWNCVAKEFVIQNPPGAVNWMIGCVGESKLMPRPFRREPLLPDGTKDSHDLPVTPRSLYLAQLAERLGPKALKNIGY